MRERRLEGIIAVVLLVLLTGCQPILRSEARDIVVREVVQPDTLDHPVRVFLLPDRLTRGDTVAALGFPETTDTMSGLTWMAWIDDEPDAEFAHATRYVYVNARTRSVRVETKVWYPVINETVIPWLDRSKWVSENELVFSHPPHTENDVRDAKP